ncbi:MAG: LPD38 domain-containing protein [Thermotogota bacterium]|nr:LPD38 domain-containing protein [Thermotogota bacterium]
MNDKIIVKYADGSIEYGDSSEKVSENDIENIKWDDEKDESHQDKPSNQTYRNMLGAFVSGAMIPLKLIATPSVALHEAIKDAVRLFKGEDPTFGQDIARLWYGNLIKGIYEDIAGESLAETIKTKTKFGETPMGRGIADILGIIEETGELLIDPFLGSAVLAKSIVSKVPKGFRIMPQSERIKILRDMGELEAKDLNEKIGLQRKLLGTLKEKVDKDVESTMMAVEDAFRAMEGGKPLSQLEIVDEALKTGLSKRTLKPAAKKIPKTATQSFENAKAIIEKAGGDKVVQWNIRGKPIASFNIPGPDTQANIKISEVTPKSVKTLIAERKAAWQKTPESKATPTKSIRASGGLVFGIDEDEEGNLTYDIGKGLAGTVGVAAGGTILSKKRFAKTLSKNPEWKKVHEMVGKQPRKSFSFSGLWGRFVNNWVDDFHPLKKVTPETYKEVMAYNSTRDISTYKFNELKDAFKNVRNDEVFVTDYIDAHRALTRAKHPKAIKNPDDISMDDALKAIEQIKKEYQAAGKDIKVLDKALEDFQSFTKKHILDESLESGVLDKKRYDEIVKNNEFYATFDIIEDLPSDLTKIPAGIKGPYFSLHNQKIIKAMKGTVKKIRNPIQATLDKFSEAQDFFARNRVANTFIDEMLTIPGEQRIWPVATSKKKYKILKNMGFEPVMEGAWSKKEFDTIGRFKEGFQETYIVEKELANAMKQMTPWQAPKVIQVYNSIFRAAATSARLPFAVWNVFRDSFMAVLGPTYKVREIFGGFQKDWLIGLKEGTKHEVGLGSDLMEQYVTSGGGFGRAGAEAFVTKGKVRYPKSELFRKSLTRKGVEIISSPIQLIMKTNNVLEATTRLGTFRRAKLALPVKEAALRGKAATINFNRQGVWARIINQFVPFFSARIGARTTMVEAFKADPKGATAKAFLTTVLPGMGLYASNRMYYSDLYDDIDKYIREEAFCFIYGSEKDENGKTVPKYFVVPKGDVGKVIWNPIEFALDKMLVESPKKVVPFFVNLLNDLSPIEFARDGEISGYKAMGGLTPPIVKGPLEDWANLKFYEGTEIEPYYLKKTKPPELRYIEEDLGRQGTPELYKYLSKMLNRNPVTKKLGLSPLRLKNYAKNIVAGYGTEGGSPKAMWRGLRGRFIKTKGGEKKRQAWVVVKDIEEGYIRARAFAEEFVKDNKKSAAIVLMDNWNKSLSEKIEQIEQYGVKDKGGLSLSYRFTPAKRKNILIRRHKKLDPLEKRLTRGRR